MYNLFKYIYLSIYIYIYIYIYIIIQLLYKFDLQWNKNKYLVVLKH